MEVHSVSLILVPRTECLLPGRPPFPPGPGFPPMMPPGAPPFPPNGPPAGVPPPGAFPPGECLLSVDSSMAVYPVFRCSSVPAEWRASRIQYPIPFW